MDITVNGGAPVAVNFPSTSTWPNWQSATVPVTLQAGTNTIRATATAAAGGPNVDYLELS